MHATIGSITMVTTLYTFEKSKYDLDNQTRTRSFICVFPQQSLNDNLNSTGYPGQPGGYPGQPGGYPGQPGQQPPPQQGTAKVYKIFFL